MRPLSPQRRKVVVLAAGVACMSGIAPILLEGHRTLGLIWIGCMAVELVYAIVQFTKLRAER